MTRFLSAIQAQTGATFSVPGTPVALVSDPNAFLTVLFETSAPSTMAALVPIGNSVPDGMRFVNAVPGPFGPVALYATDPRAGE